MAASSETSRCRRSWRPMARPGTRGHGAGANRSGTESAETPPVGTDTRWGTDIPRALPFRSARACLQNRRALMRRRRGLRRGARDRGAQDRLEHAREARLEILDAQRVQPCGALLALVDDAGLPQ